MIPKLQMRSACADKNDALGWSDGAVLCVGQRHLGLRSDSESLLAEMLSMAVPAGASSHVDSVNGLFSLKAGGPGKRRGQKNYYVLYDGWTQVARSLDKEPVLQEFRARWLSAVATTLYPETNITREAVVLGVGDQAHAWIGLNGASRADVLKRAAQAGVQVLSSTALVLNLTGTVRRFPDDVSAQADLVDLDGLPATRLASLTYVDDVEAALPLTPGQGALRMLGQVIGNATLVGELLALSNALVSAHCRVVPASGLQELSLLPEPALAP